LGGPVSGEIVAPDSEFAAREFVDSGEATANVMPAGGEIPLKQSEHRSTQCERSLFCLPLQLSQHSALPELWPTLSSLALYRSACAFAGVAMPIDAATAATMAIAIKYFMNLVTFERWQMIKLRARNQLAHSSRPLNLEQLGVGPVTLSNFANDYLADGLS
jgi:hypothetical protein